MSRLLSSLEEDSRLATVRREWSWFDRHWYPLTESSRKDVLAFDIDVIRQHLAEAKLRTALAGAGISNVFWFPAQDPTIETKFDQIGDLYAATEAFLVDETYKWIIYWSNEGTITFGGRLLESIKAAIPEWSQLQTSFGDGDGY